MSHSQNTLGSLPAGVSLTLEIPPGEFDAYLFDCDGTLADSMPLHWDAWRAAFAPYGCEFSEELFYSWGGIPTRTIIEQLNAAQNLRMPVGEVDRVREDFYLARLDTIPPIIEVIAQVNLYRGKKPMGVVSGSPRESVERTLERLGIADAFNVIVAGGEAPRGKPFPDPYLKAAHELGVEPSRCLVFEDAELGIQSARDAGMKWVKVPTPLERRSVTAEH